MTDPNIPDVPRVPEVPQVPDVPQVPQVPQVPEIPRASAETPPAAPPVPPVQPAGTGYGAPTPPPAYGAPTPPPPGYGAPAAKQPVLSIISLVAGVIGIIGSPVVFIPIVGGIMGLFVPAAAVVLGFLGRSKEPRARGFWLTGLIAGFVGVGLALASIIIWSVLFANYRMGTRY